MRSAFAAACLLACAGSALAQERWQSTFQQGYSFATISKRNGPSLQLSCDTSGRKPGRGSISIEFRVAKAAPAPAARAEFVATAAGQIIRFEAKTRVSPARDEIAGSERRNGAGRTLVSTRPSATEDVVELTYDLDGSPDAARPMTALVAALAKEPREIIVKAPALNLEAKLATQQAARAVRGFEQGCQDAIPAADDEMQWDWQQGLDRVDGKSQPTIAAAAEGGDETTAKLMLRCAGDRLQAVVTRPPGGGADNDAPLALTVENANSDSTQSLWHGSHESDGKGNGSWKLEGEHAARLIATLWRGTRASFAAPSSTAAPLAFPIDGVPLAARKLIEACPTPLLPPKP
ncbi:hypothetical protein [Terrarubrum flagellatum]|uniref:hypothetical protein n=1 Tax=Terrirubrum flagellatum TaxID=2895980 RepID=UPI0031453448